MTIESSVIHDDGEFKVLTLSNDQCFKTLRDDPHWYDRWANEMAELNDRLQWVYSVYLLGGLRRHVDVRRGVLCESYSIDGEDVTSAIIGLTKRGLVDTNKMESYPHACPSSRNRQSEKDPMTQAITLNNYEKARAQLLVKHPFYASLVLSTEWIPDETIPTAQTDYTKVYFNPKWLEPKPINDITFIMIHEIKHIILEHNKRMRSRKPKRWNHACDYAINQEEVDAGLSMPIDDKGEYAGLCDKQFTGMTAEQIYDFLTLMKKQQGPKGKKKGDPGQGKGNAEPDDDEDDENDPSDQLANDLTGPSGKDGKQDLTQAEEGAISDRIKGMVAQAATIARAAGKLPHHLEILVDGVINPPQPWEVILREFMQRMIQTSETWNRRNRRFTQVLPTRYDVGMGELVIIGDTSASMLGDKIWAQVAEEINYCNEYVKPERTRVIWADARARNHEQTFEQGEEVKLEPRGGGGTDMRLPLAYVEKYDPCCVIIITDCQTPWPDEPTPFPLIVASTTNTPCPDWALRLQLRNNHA